MEYIPYGNIGDYLAQNVLPKKQFISLLKQSILCLIELYDRFQLHHHDIHSGNVLINFHKESRVINSYYICGKVFKVDTYGCEPVFIDFGRASRSSNKDSKNTGNSSNSEWSYSEDEINWTLQEVMVLLEIYINNLQSKSQISYTKKIIQHLEKYSKSELKKCVKFIHGLES